MSATKLQLNGNVLAIEGELTRHTITRGFEKAGNKFQSTALTAVDLSHVPRVDTAGLAWLLSLVECAKRTGNELSFSPVSHDLLKLAKLTGVESFLQRQ
ncbi:STAS domain-containing protein [Thalassotalea fusca]